MESKKIVTMVVTHKDYSMPQDEMYLPVCVGIGKEQLRSKFTPDDAGENISELNPQYCELTALYWAWKNLNCDILGLVHYRRHMTLKRKCNSLKDVLSSDEALILLNTYDIIAIRRWYPETVKVHYIKCHRNCRELMSKHIELLRETISELSPECIDCFDNVMNGHSAYMFNMFIMEKSESDKYCEWVFPILFCLENKIKNKGVEYERLMGTLAEFLFNVWIEAHHKNVKAVKLYAPEASNQLRRFIYRRFFEK